MAPCSLSTGRMRTLTGGFLHDQFPGGNEGFFIGQGDIHPPRYGPQGRFNTGCPDKRREDHVRPAFIDKLQQSTVSGKDAARGTDSVSHLFGSAFIDHTSHLESWRCI